MPLHGGEWKTGDVNIVREMMERQLSRWEMTYHGRKLEIN